MSCSSGNSGRIQKAAIVCLVLVVIALTICLIVAVSKRDDVEKSENDNEAEISDTFKYTGIVTQNSQCSQIGVDVLIGQGGSAVDAVVATSFCLGVLHNPWTGIGGGNLLTIYERPNTGGDKEVVTMIGRERAPLAATWDMFANDSVRYYGGLAIAVPGEVKVLHEAWKLYGRLEWSTLVQPAARLAEDGFPVSRGCHNILRRREEFVREAKSMREIFVKPSGELYAEGDTLRLPKLAKTLRTIAAEGADAFYNGSLTDDIVADIQEFGGIITKKDLNEYSAPMKSPEAISLSGGKYTVYGPPPPSSAVLVEYILNILDGYNMTSQDVKDPEALALTYHRIVEALKYGYSERSKMGDEDHVENMAAWKRLLTDNAFGKSIRQRIDDLGTHETEHYFPGPDMVEDHGTHHMSVLSPDGAAVSMTSTLNLWFGANRIGSRTGIIFNDEMADFAIPEDPSSAALSGSNYIEGGKRPMSSMSPVLVFDDQGDVVMVVGSAGGMKIISAIAQIMIDALWLEKPLADAMIYPRVHNQLLPNTLFVETDFDKTLIADLKQRGHVIDEYSSRPSAVTAILKKCPNSPDCSECPNCPECAGPCLQASCDILYRHHCKPRGY